MSGTKRRFLSVILWVHLWVFAGALPHQILDEYVTMGVESNLLLKQKDMDYRRSVQALREARRRYFPSAWINARYTRAGGGRVIDFPIGDMLNPIHRTLNSMLISGGGTAGFPENVENQRFYFFRPEEHDTAIRIVQPVFNQTLLTGIRIQSDLRKISELLREQYRRELVFEIQKAYFNYLKARRAVQIHINSRRLIRENREVCRSLYRRGVRTREVVLRSEVEMARGEERIQEAERKARQAASYFNFLLNRPLDAEIKIMKSEPRVSLEMDSPGAVDRALKNREEIQLYRLQIRTAGKKVKLHRGTGLPAVSAVLDFGYQGESYRFNEDHDYWMATLNLQWKFFSSGVRESRVAQSRLDLSRTKLELEELRRKIRLQVEEAWDQMVIARKNRLSVEKRVQMNEEVHRIVTRKFESGVISQVEWLNAQTALQNARMAQAIQHYDYKIHMYKVKCLCAIQEMGESKPGVEQ